MQRSTRARRSCERSPTAAELGSSRNWRKISPRYSPVSRSSAAITPWVPRSARLPAMEEARAVGAIVAFPCFTNPAKPFRFVAGDPLEPGPFGLMQPARRHPRVEPDLVLVPLVAIDGSGTRLGRGKGHYDRALLSLKKNGARLIGVGWAMQRLTEEIPGDAWDVPLDGFASPDGLELFEPS